MILSEDLFKDILRPRVYLIQQNNTLLYQNLSIIHNYGFFNLNVHRIQDIAQLVKQNSYRDVVICNYSNNNN